VKFTITTGVFVFTVAAVSGFGWILTAENILVMRFYGSGIFPIQKWQMADGIHVQFQIMSLAGIKISDPEGKTHHVMASFMKDDAKIEKAVGKIKLIAPSGKEQLGDLRNYGGSAFVANFNINEPDKCGKICLFKDETGKHTVKFWYDQKWM
jgi:hypothetical protein